MTEKELKLRTRKFTVEILNFVDELPYKRSANIIGAQLGRSASSVASNYRAACRARSVEFISKIGIVEEADGSTFWLDIIPDTKSSAVELVARLLKEARELTAITAASKTAKQNKSAKISQSPNSKTSL